MRGATNRAGCRTKTLIQTYLAFECYGFESIAIVENLSCVHPVQSNPVVPSPTKHAATGRTANIANRLSNGRNSACLNFTELQRGHFRRIQRRCGSQSGQSRLAFAMPTILPGHTTAQAKMRVSSGKLPLVSNQERRQRMLPLASAMLCRQRHNKDLMVSPSAPMVCPQGKTTSLTSPTRS